jgi:xanthine dehydrogenase large subunit
MADASRSPLHQSLAHESGLRHTSGGGPKYIDDLPEPPGTLHGAVVSSKVARGALISVDGAARPGPARRAVGPQRPRTFPGVNNVGPVFHDEPLFAKAR